MTEVSPVQHGIWINELAAAGSAYHMPLVIRLEAPVDEGALAKACAALVERHPLLGMAFAKSDGVPRLVLAQEPPALSFEERAEAFDLARGPLVRFTLSGRSLRVVAHHAVFDGRSKEVLVADLLAAYRGEVLPPLEPVTPREAPADDARAFWASRWRAPAEVLVPGGVLRSRRAGEGRVLEFPLDVPDIAGLTRFEVLMAALHAVLGSYGNTTVVTAIDLSTRTPDEEDRIGPFVNELPLFSEPRPGTPFAVFAGSLRAELREIYRHRRVPLARAVQGLKPHAALAPVSVSYRRGGGDERVDWLAFNGAVRGAFQLQLLDGPAGLAASLRYDALELPDPRPIVAGLRAWLEKVAGDPSVPLPAAALPAAASTATLDSAGSADPVGGSESSPGLGDDPLLAGLTAIWEEVLQLSPIEPHDDIFDLGGHSLTITQIIARMRKRLNIEVELDDFFDNPTIAGVLGVIRR
ncbi:condensation domain-containing protein [Nonomuraea sp. bgisy101]|uniref:condensation domain-containing protein n=1 Tax=Nonomuraea sp. bgisy101 TaxID=3413784 RepID=UPI003D74D7B1